MNKSRASVVAALLITGFAVAYAGGSAITGWEPSIGWLIQTIIHLGELLIVLALAGSGAGGHSRTFRVGMAAVVVGQLTIVAAEVVWLVGPDLGDVLFGVAPMLIGAGLITIGVTTLRAGVWAGWSRFLPLGFGLYTLLALIPVMIGSGGPPAPVALWTIAGWDLLWFALGATVLSRTRPSAPAGRAPAKATLP
jgi:hypothetical protein